MVYPALALVVQVYTTDSMQCSDHKQTDGRSFNVKQSNANSTVHVNTSTPKQKLQQRINRVRYTVSFLKSTLFPRNVS